VLFAIFGGGGLDWSLLIWLPCALRFRSLYYCCAVRLVCPAWTLVETLFFSQPIFHTPTRWLKSPITTDLYIFFVYPLKFFKFLPWTIHRVWNILFAQVIFNFGSYWSNETPNLAIIPHKSNLIDIFQKGSEYTNKLVGTWYTTQGSLSQNIFRYLKKYKDIQTTVWLLQACD
jgi:hypothetical protein